MGSETKLGAIILVLSIFVLLVGFVIAIFVYPEISLQYLNSLTGALGSINWDQLLPFLIILVLVVIIGLVIVAFGFSDIFSKQEIGYE
ncbi:MAG: hypothetical protein ACLFS3_00510 [Candidatus Aenigmatarchaeota archaeon]